jgi:hypothetical protein
MPRLVARQWHTLRGSRLCRPQHVVRPALAASLRAYASGSNAFPTIKPRHSAIIIPESLNNKVSMFGTW